MKTSIFIFSICLLLSTSLVGQNNAFKNSIEASLTVGNYYNNVVEMREGLGYALKYQRTIYTGKINSFSVGLVGQHNTFKHFGSSYAGGLSSYILISQQETNALGIVIGDRLSAKVFKLRCFLEGELSGLYQLSLQQETTLFLAGEFAPEPYPTIDIDQEPAVNNMVYYAGLKAGVEFNVSEEIAMFLSYGLSVNINPIYPELLIPPMLIAVTDYYLPGYTLNCGIRF